MITKKRQQVNRKSQDVFREKMKSHGLVSYTDWVTPERKKSFRLIALNDRRAIIEAKKNEE